MSNFVFLIEELIAAVLFALCFLACQPIVKLTYKNIYSRSSNTKNQSQRFIYVIAAVIILSVLVSVVLFCIIWLYHDQYGVPNFYQAKEQLLEHKKLEFHPNVPAPHWYNISPFSIYLYIAPFMIGSALLFMSLFGIEEYLRYYHALQENKLKKEKQAKELALSKVYAIQHQLNPHFMFNTLNVLSGLMHEDLNKADKFIKELSEIYRYVLLQSEEIVSSLEKEIEFANSYIYLLKIRFEDKIFVNININKDKLNWLLPSLTLELLIENAIKHNSLESDNPLAINIYTDDENLIVKNDIHPRMDQANSIGIGINNLKKRLSALGIETASFKASKDYYTATIPLIKSI